MSGSSVVAQRKQQFAATSAFTAQAKYHDQQCVASLLKDEGKRVAPQDLPFSI